MPDTRHIAELRAVHEQERAFLLKMAEAFEEDAASGDEDAQLKGELAREWRNAADILGRCIVSIRKTYNQG